MSLMFLMSLLLLQTPQVPQTPADSVITAIGIDQKLGVPIDGDIPFRDERGQVVHLGDFFGKKPIILTPVYYECPMLCSMQLNGLVRALRVMPFAAGKEFEIVTFSIDPGETPELAASKKQHYVRDYGKPTAEAGWHFLAGEEESIRRLTELIGFRYMYDAPIDQWAHASAIVVLTPDGRVSQYFYGIEHDPGDLKYSLIEASGGKIGSLIDHALLFCYRYNPATGKYSLAIMRIVRLAGLATALGLVAFMVFGGRRNKNQPQITQITRI
jgi:protein SCO1/2